MPSSFDDYARAVEASRGSEFADEVRRVADEFALSWQLRERRLSLGLTQAGLASKTGIPQSEISRIESGAANPTLNTVTTLSDALGVRLALSDL